MPEFVTPPSLNPGDSVAIVSPASGLAAEFPHVYQRGLERIRSVFELEPREFPTATKSDEYLQANPVERAQDIEAAFRDPEIRGVIATIGGNDQIQILRHLDPEILRENPTRFYGISDNTNLMQFLWNQGIVSFYGGHVLTEFAAPGEFPTYLEHSLRSALFEDSIGSIQPAPAFTDQDLGWDDPAKIEAQPEMESNDGWIWRGSQTTAHGRVWGGNLEVTYLQLASNRYVPSEDTLSGSILAIETSEELPEQGVIRRMLMAFGERGLLERFDGVLVGRIKARSHLADRSADERARYRQELRETMTNVITDYNPTIPIVFNVDFGHTNPIVPIPIGGTVHIDPTNETISFE
jgi:muramoyltetrapeptide carboxypeptidase LdcA involved in peptidoglycan recycling